MQNNTSILEMFFFTEDEKEKLLKTSGVFCMAPFTSLHINIEGKVFPCCNSAGYLDDKIGDLKKNNSLQETWNSVPMKNLRTQMLREEPVRMCTACYRDEDLNKTSLRQLLNKQYAQHQNRLNETATDGTLLNSAVLFLDVRFSNICNFSCRICSHYFSSHWFKEAKQLNLVAHNGNSISYAASDMDGFIHQLNSLLPYIEKIQFAGGEPLMSVEHYQVLSELLKLKRTDVQLLYNTNFSLLNFKGNNLVELWKQFSQVQISASLDGMGPRGELMRKGQVWSEVEKNRKVLMQECPHILFQVNTAVSIMNLWHLPDFYTDWVARGYISTDGLDAYLVTEPAYFDIQRLPKLIKEQVMAKYLEFFKHAELNFEGFSEKAKMQFDFLLQYMNEENLPMANDFFYYTSQLDEFRQEKFYQVFPELSNLQAYKNDFA